MSFTCDCFIITFGCEDASTFDIIFSKTNQFINGNYLYIGNFGGKNYTITYTTTPTSKWILTEENDFLNIIYETTTSPAVPCLIDFDEFIPVDLSNFKYCSGNESPVSIINIIEDESCIPYPDDNPCENCSCWTFSGKNDYNIRYYTCDGGEAKNLFLSSGSTANVCLRGTPAVFPSTTIDFYSAKTLNSCFIDCIQIGNCECLTVTMDGNDMGFVVGGTQNDKTFWTTNYDGDDFIIFWDGDKWVFAINVSTLFDTLTEIAISNTTGICPPTGNGLDNWTIYDPYYEDFNITTYDCYPNFNIKKCWTITATTDYEIITFYDYLNADEKKVFLYEGDVMEVCAFDKPVSSEISTLIVESDKSCSNICGSLNICGCINVSFGCGEVGLYGFNATPSGTINGYPLFINGITFFRFDGTWVFYNSNTFQIIAESRAKNGFCPFFGTWDVYNSFPCCFAPYNMIVSARICGPIPTLPPTPTPTPIPYVIPTCNECIPTTVFDMDVECIPTNPTSPSAADGSISLSISGGTSPYEITWSNGNIGPDIFNLVEGSYTATTTDYYGDFTAVTICELLAVRPTTTTTTTISPQPTGDTLCMLITTIQSTGSTTESIEFQPDVVVNGKLSWESTNGDTLIWNNSTSRWEVIFNPPRTYFVLSQNGSQFPPLNNWIVVGLSGSVIVTEGECPVEIMLMGSKTKNVSFKSLMNKGNNFNDLFL